MPVLLRQPEGCIEHGRAEWQLRALTEHLAFTGHRERTQQAPPSRSGHQILSGHHALLLLLSPPSSNHDTVESRSRG
jgi:hypothetical protein